jgi:FixJ family two-component response regulator
MKMNEFQDNRDERILILAPTGRDAALTARHLIEAGLHAEACNQIQELCEKMREGAGVIFLTGEVLTLEAMRCLIESLAAQPAWSDIPLIVLTSGGGETPANTEVLTALSEAGNMTLIERPVRLMTLMSAIKSALRARHRQYDVRDREGH